jgi:hypothetical protein
MHDMSYGQREQLATSVNAVIADLCVEEVALLLQMLLQSPHTKEAVLRSVFEFLQKEMQLQIVD